MVIITSHEYNICIVIICCLYEQYWHMHRYMYCQGSYHQIVHHWHSQHRSVFCPCRTVSQEFKAKYRHDTGVMHQMCLVVWTWRKLAEETNAKNAPKIC